MIVVSNGLEAIKTDQHYGSLSRLIGNAFKGAHIDEILLSMIQMKQYFFFKNNKPIAVVSLRKKGYLVCTGTYHTNTIYNVATAPYYRKKGYMKKIFRRVFDDMRKQRKKYAHLEVLKTNTKAINLYKKLGFKIIYECAPTSSHKGIYLMRLRLR